MRVHLLSLLLLALAFAGCVEEDGAPDAPDAPPADPQDDDVPVDIPDIPEVEPVIETVSLDGASPRGFWVCALAPVLGTCDIYWEDTGSHSHEIEHAGTITAISLTVTFTAATPETRGIEMFLATRDDTTWTHVGMAAGPTGTTLALTDLNITADQALILQAWNMPDADANGPIWIDPVPQPYHIEGTLTTTRNP